MKTVWISALIHDEARVAVVTAQLKRYGLHCQGHFWEDGPDKMSWQPALEAMKSAHAELWLILADDVELAKPTVRHGLSLFAAMANAQRDVDFPIVLLWNSKTPVPTPATLPDLLQSASLIEEANPAWQAKIVARVNKTSTLKTADYRLNILGDERLGQWFEIGPRHGSWDGVLFGVSGENATIEFQAVGLQNGLPEKTILELAQQGLRLKAGERDFTAWALRNQVDTASSYYARVKGNPEAILFSPYPEEGELDATIIRMS
ncbi:MAG: hypothetical protein K0R08_91 [Solimicrobium sp.]|jgi:hypothetical protein|nr:hypothetical protein [Solimicrobium sp.]